MVCKGKQSIPHASPVVEAKAFPGELGFVEIVNTSKEPQPVVGQVTSMSYLLNPMEPAFVDKRDAIFILGGEFSLAEELQSW